MEIIDENKNQNEGTNANTNADQSATQTNSWDKHRDNNKFIIGLLIAGVGCLLLAREMGFYFPHWLFSWPMILIVAGIISGVKNSFQNAGSYIMILIGSAFLIRNYFLPEFNLGHYMWPVVIILVGFFMMAKPGKFFNNSSRRFNKDYNYNTNQWQQTTATNGDEFIDSSAVFGSVKKNIVSKNFKGGEANSVFGSTEINLSHADIEGTVQLEVNAVLGSIRVIVPSHWEVKSELSAVLGNVEDKRPIARNVSGGLPRVLILKGAAVFGGIEILSYV